MPPRIDVIARMIARLSARERALLARVVDANRQVTLDALADADLDEPIFAVCLWRSQEDHDLTADLNVATASDRRRLLAEAPTPYERFRSLWNPNDYSLMPDSAQPESVDPGYLEAEAALVQALRARGVLDPPLEVLRVVARGLNQDPPPIPRDDLFVAFVLDPDIAQELLATLRLVTTAPVRDALRAADLLPPTLRSLPGWDRLL